MNNFKVTMDLSNTQYYCEKTEVLTESGFKLIKQLQSNDLVAVIDNNRFLRYKPVENITKHQYTGNVIQFINNCIDALFIPGHKLYVGTQLPYQEANADSKIHEYNIQKTIGWDSIDLYSNDDFVSFLGYLHGCGRIVNKYIIIDNIYRDTNLYDILFRLPFKWRSINRDSIIIDDILLREYILRFHYIHNKFIIPAKIRMTSVKQISLFLTSFFGKHWGVYTTNNHQYISKIQELITKMGGNSEIYKRSDNCYVLINNNGIYLNYPKPILQRKYSGLFYKINVCTEHENELIYIRRNGKTFISYA